MKSCIVKQVYLYFGELAGQLDIYTNGKLHVKCTNSDPKCSTKSLLRDFLVNVFLPENHTSTVLCFYTC